MRIRKPVYYDSFRCIASACRDTCCAGWEIDIDPDARELYSRMPGPLGEKLRACMEPQIPSPGCTGGGDTGPETGAEEEAGGETFSFRLAAGDRCPFLTEENLCELILKEGEGCLCEICREHPRFHEWFGPLRESGLGLCCEEAARLILGEKGPFPFAEEESREEKEEPVPEEELPLLGALFFSRETAFSLLEAKGLSLGERCALLLSFGAELQDLLDEGDVSGIRCLSEAYTQGNAALLPRPTRPLETRNTPAPADTAGKLLTFFAGLEPLEAEWPGRLLSLRDGLLLRPKGRKAPPLPPDGTENAGAYENLLSYFVYRYWMKSFFDGELLPKAKLAAAAFFLVSLLDAAGPSSFEETVQNAKAFSKEVEYSGENLSAFYDASWEEDFLSLSALLPLFLPKGRVRPGQTSPGECAEFPWEKAFSEKGGKRP